MRDRRACAGGEGEVGALGGAMQGQAWGCRRGSLKAAERGPSPPFPPARPFRTVTRRAHLERRDDVPRPADVLDLLRLIKQRVDARDDALAALGQIGVHGDHSSAVIQALKRVWV